MVWLILVISIADERVSVHAGKTEIPWEHVPYLSASAVVIHYEEVLYQNMTFTFTLKWLPWAGHTQTWPWAFMWKKDYCKGKGLQPYFPAKTGRDPHQHDMVANFWNAPTVWFQGGTGPHSAPQWLPIGALLKDSTWPFSSTGHLLENHIQGPRRQTTIFSAILHGALDKADDAFTLLQIWLTFYSGFWENKFEVWIYHPLWRLLR